MDRDELVSDYVARMASEGGRNFDRAYFEKRYPEVDPTGTIVLGQKLSEIGLDVRYVYHPLFKTLDGKAHQIKTRSCSGIDGAINMINREKRDVVFLLSMDDGVVRYCVS